MYDFNCKNPSYYYSKTRKNKNKNCKHILKDLEPSVIDFKKVFLKYSDDVQVGAGTLVMDT